MNTIKIIICLAVCLLVAVVVAGMYKFNYLAGQPGYDVDGNRTEISNFDECVAAGYPVMRSYPAQCSDGKQVFEDQVDNTGPAVSSYEDCVERGYPVMESYPEQCSDGTNTFVRDINKEKVLDGPDVIMPVEPDDGIGDGAVPLDELIGVKDSAPKLISLLGMTEEKAQKIAQENNVMFRVVTRDGEPQMVTMDYVVGRINASVSKGIVDGYSLEGADDQQNKSAQKALFETIRELENSEPQY